MLALYIFGWIVFGFSLIYFLKNQHKFGDEDYSGLSWIFILISFAISIILLITQVLVTFCWIFGHIKII